MQSSPNQPERLQKAMARIGVASRRASEEMIAEGRVRINGVVATLGDKVTEDDEIQVDKHILSTKPDAVTYLLNKPRKVVSTASDPEGRRIVLDFVPDEPRVFPVGRLDYDTEGLLLLTNDGGLAHRLTHPSFGVDKEYLVQVKGRPAKSVIRMLRTGVELEDGKTAPAKVSLVSPDLLRLVIHEGRNRQVRRMCDAVGHPVVRLVRSRIGTISDTTLKPGMCRKLTDEELLTLQRAILVTKNDG